MINWGSEILRTAWLAKSLKIPCPWQCWMSIIALSCLVTSFSLALLMRSTMIYTMTSLIRSRLNQRCNLLAPMTRKESWYQTRSGTRISSIFFLSPAFVLRPILFAAFSFLRFTVSQLAAKGMEDVVSSAPLWKILTRTFWDHMSSPWPGCCALDGKCYLCSALGGQAFIVVAIHRVTGNTGLSELDRGIQFVAVNRKSLRRLFLLL